MYNFRKTAFLSFLLTAASLFIIGLREPKGGDIYLVGEHIKVYTIEYINTHEFVITWNYFTLIGMFLMYALLIYNYSKLVAKTKQRIINID